MADSPEVRDIDRPTSKRVGALTGLLPFLIPYRMLLMAAFLALLLTASVSLILPLAVRRVVDGFGSADAALLTVISPRRWRWPVRWPWGRALGFTLSRALANGSLQIFARRSSSGP